MAASPDKPISAKHALFLAEYRTDRNATRAYRAVYGAPPKSADASARKLLANPRIQAEIARLDSKRAEKLHIDVERVLGDAYAILMADPRELVELRLGACRYCYGEGHLWQRTVGEFNKELEEWTEKRGKPIETFDHKGGIGFDSRKAPCPSCPECAGSGHHHIVPKDTRYLSPTALALYAGVHHGKEGLKILMHDKHAAREQLFKHLGLYEKDNAQKHSPLGVALKAFVEKMHADRAAALPMVARENIRRIK